MAIDVLTPDTLIHCGVPAGLAHTHVPLMQPAMREHAITTRARARMFIAQVLEESARLQFFEEIASGAEYEGRIDLGNTHPGDGRRYKGRGPIQLTGRRNYANYGKRLGLDLEGHPEIAARPSVGWRIAALYFQINCNDAADAGNFELVTRRINGGLRGYSVRQQYYRLLDGRGVLPGRPYLRVGDHGPAIVTMTRRLSHLRSPSTGKVYLDGKRETFDDESARALRRFQADHKLHVDGHFGPKSAQALQHAIELAKAAHARPAHPPGPVRPRPRPRPPAPKRPGRPATAVELIARMNTLDDRSDRLLRALERRRHVLQQLLERGGGTVEGEIDDLAARMARLEVTVGQIRTELTTVESGGTVHTAPSATAGGTVTAVITQAAPVVATPETNGHDLAHATPAQLAARLAELNREGDEIRAVLLDRYTAIERAAGTLDPPRPAPAPPVVHRPAPPGPRPARPKPGPQPTPKPAPHHTEDGHDGSAGAPRPGGRAWPIRQSKLAVQRYLKAKDPSGTLKLRRALQRERLSPRTSRSATPTWAEAITAAQRLAGLPQTGKLDGQVVHVLRPFWPPESPPRRVVRGTPAWRVIPGQLTQHFNIREFACHDGTAYVTGLVREQGMTKQQAKARAKELAKRLEHLRTIEGGRAIRPTSVYRTKAYNSHVGGSAKNSAHTRGFAADVPPPPGITLQAHRQHVRAAFEGGVGYYVQMHFVHGDFDTGLGRREWNGP